MLKFNHNKLNYNSVFDVYLNTSYVKVQLEEKYSELYEKDYLNTSYVKVQHKKRSKNIKSIFNLNTSYVKVQHARNNRKHTRYSI